MRSRLCNGCRQWYPLNDGCPNCHQETVSADYHVMPDIQPFRSMCDGSMITSRSQKREHYKQFGVVEVGNETKYLKPRADLRKTGAKEAVIQAVQQAKEKHGSRYVEREITSALQRAHEMERHRR